MNTCWVITGGDINIFLTFGDFIYALKIKKVVFIHENDLAEQNMYVPTCDCHQPYFLLSSNFSNGKFPWPLWCGNQGEANLANKNTSLLQHSIKINSKNF